MKIMKAIKGVAAAATICGALSAGAVAQAQWYFETGLIANFRTKPHQLLLEQQLVYSV